MRQISLLEEVNKDSHDNGNYESEAKQWRVNESFINKIMAVLKRQAPKQDYRQNVLQLYLHTMMF